MEKTDEMLNLNKINEYIIIESNNESKLSNTSKNIFDDADIISCYDIYSEDKIFGPMIKKLLTQKNSNLVKRKINGILMSFLEKPKINYTYIRNLIFEGVPDEFQGARSIAWKLMLNYLPNTISEWYDYLKERRSDYENIKMDLLLNTPSDSTLHSEISKDVKRTRTHMHFFTSTSKVNPNETNSDILTRILFIFGKLHPNIAYVQGMNEIIAPIFYCFSIDPNPFFYLNIEADVFYCFENIMLEIKEIFLREKDESESGIHFRIEKINYLLEFYDKDLFDHFRMENIELSYFMFRWFTLFFTQEFTMPDILRLWDSILVQSEKFEFVSYLCLALVILFKQILINKDFSNIMYVMQNLSELQIDIEVLINKALEIKNKLGILFQSF